MLQGKAKAYFLVHHGHVQMLRNEAGIGPIVCTSWQAAKVMQDDIRKKDKKRVSIAEIGAVQGETLARQIAIAVIDEGATGIHVSDDGEILYYFQAPPVQEDEE